MQDSYPYVPVPVPIVPDPGVLKIIFKVSKKTVLLPHLFVCLFLVLDAGENFWNLDKKFEYRIVKILIYKDKNRHSVLPFHLV